MNPRDSEPYPMEEPRARRKGVYLLPNLITTGALRGKVHRYGPAGIPLVVTWHPAYLLRRPGAKAEAWRDLVLASGAARAFARERGPAS
jgi:uracil-DNA glycosylase